MATATIKAIEREEAIELAFVRATFAVGGAIAFLALVAPEVPSLDRAFHFLPASPAITQPGCDKTSDIGDTGVGPVRVDVAAYFAERAAAKKSLG